MNPRVLIAGIGNIFLGDDAFGVEVVRALEKRALPQGVRVMDFGIRSYDLAYALTEDYETVILVDATPQGEPPGTTYLIEPALDRLESLEPEAPDAHRMNPVSVLQMAQALGGIRAKLYLVGCEPAVVEPDTETIGLSTQVQAAVPRAVERIEALVGNALAAKKVTSPGLAPV